ncbi:hypothetical protein LNKW23_48770 [Paralimibaculum aggregatum]|uniref:DUF4345 domain-containing protein n=2 Tax=Paralimibaculum aggregatum TaxID=3036245 RepID=A0ABQ6LU94_9RHOB|nr:hypothetical protein LNKW23_48770 [Limibaculum sp. NKW23]
MSLEADRPPLAKLLLALAVGPMVLGLSILIFVFLMESLNRASDSAAMAGTMARAGTVFAYLFGFTATLGLAGMLALRLLDWRGPLVWTLVGAGAGIAAGAVYANLEGFMLERGLMTTAAMLGWGEFLVMRWVAGIR